MGSSNAITRMARGGAACTGMKGWPAPMLNAELTFSSGETSLSVRSFRIEDAVSKPFTVSVLARSPNQIDLESIVGRPAALRIDGGDVGGGRIGRDARRWSGVCQHIEQVQAEPTGLSTYELRIGPDALAPHAAPRLPHLPAPRHPRHRRPRARASGASRPRGRSTAGATRSSSTRCSTARATTPSSAACWRRRASPSPSRRRRRRHPARARRRARTRRRPDARAALRRQPQHGRPRGVRHRAPPLARGPPRRVHLRDYDFRRPSFALFGEAREARRAGGPVRAVPLPARRVPRSRARRAATRPSPTTAASPATTSASAKTAPGARSPAERVGRRSVSFRTSILDLAPGVGVLGGGPPARRSLAAARASSCSSQTIEGAIDGEWTMRGRAVFADAPYAPPLVTPKPPVDGVQSATVVGPPGEEIHTDEFGRVRVQFPWDREGKNDDQQLVLDPREPGLGGHRASACSTSRASGRRCSSASSKATRTSPSSWAASSTRRTRSPTSCPSTRRGAPGRAAPRRAATGSTRSCSRTSPATSSSTCRPQKDLRKLVKNDETITVGNDRQKLVKGNETEVVAGEPHRGHRSATAPRSPAATAPRRSRGRGASWCAARTWSAWRATGSSTWAATSTSMVVGREARAGARRTATCW